MSVERSIEGETEKAIRFYNLIREIADDIYELPADKNYIEKMGEITSVACVVIRKRGAERFGSTTIDLRRYLEYLEIEYHRMVILYNISLTTGGGDLFDISQKIFGKAEERIFGKEKS